jgi:hypothetical protein
MRKTRQMRQADAACSSESKVLEGSGRGRNGSISLKKIPLPMAIINQFSIDVNLLNSR